MGNEDKAFLTVKSKYSIKASSYEISGIEQAKIRSSYWSARTGDPLQQINCSLKAHGVANAAI